MPHTHKETAGGKEGFMLPQEIPGAHEKILNFDNLGRRNLQLQIVQLFGNEPGIETYLHLIDIHLSLAFDFAGRLLDYLKSVNPDLAKKWQKVWTGHNVSYPLLSGSPQK